MRIKTLILGVLIAVLAFGTVELVLRVFDPFGIRYYSEAKRYFASMIPNADYVYIHPPHLKGRFQGVDVLINSEGFRGPEFDRRKPEGKSRLMILGDSIVFGWGAPQDVIFTAQIQRLMDREVPELGVEVISAGVGSWNTRTEYEYFKARGIDFEPDVLVLLIAANDLEPQRTIETGINQEHFSDEDRKQPILTAKNKSLRVLWQDGVSRSFVLQHFAHFFKMKRLVKQQRLNPAPSPEFLSRWDDARLALEGIIRLCREQDIEFIPYFFDTVSGVKNHDVLSRYQHYFEEAGLPVHFLSDEILEKAAEYKNSKVDSHLNAKGHAAFAQEMFQALRPVLEKRLRPKPVMKQAENQASQMKGAEG